MFPILSYYGIGKISCVTYGFKTALALTLILAIILALYNFPVFFYSTISKLNPVRKLKELISIHGSALFISDLRLRDYSNREFYGKIGLFVEESNVSTIVIVSDWFNSPKSISYSDYGELFGKALDKMDLLNRNITIFLF